MRLGFFLLVAALAIGLSGPALAQGRRAPGRAAAGPHSARKCAARIPGEFYDADGPTPGPGGSEHYHLKWMTPDGRIEWLDTDARTGRVLGASPGRDSVRRPRCRRAISHRRPRYPAPQDSHPAAMDPMRGGGYGGRGDFGGRGGGASRALGKRCAFCWSKTTRTCSAF